MPPESARRTAAADGEAFRCHMDAGAAAALRRRRQPRPGECARASTMRVYLFFLPMLAGATFLLPFTLRRLMVNLPLLDRSRTRKPEVRARARFVPPSFCTRGRGRPGTCAGGQSRRPAAHPTPRRGGPEETPRVEVVRARGGTRDFRRAPPSVSLFFEKGHTYRAALPPLLVALNHEPAEPRDASCASLTKSSMRRTTRESPLRA